MSELCAHLDDIQAAAGSIAPFAHKTPVLRCSALDKTLDAQLYFKCENFQKVGAFKFRGACNAVTSLSEEELKRGVATHSSGNHAAALALSAKLAGSSAHIVMPSNAPAVKKAAVEGYGAKITYCEPTLEARERTLAHILENEGRVLIHPYNDARIIAGQGTAALELLEEVGELDVVMAPVGGGGLLSGTSIAFSESNPTTKVIGAEPLNADDAYRSTQTGEIQPSDNPQTIADGLLTSLGELTFAIIQERCSSIVTVSEESIVEAMRLVWERMKIIIEPSAAVPVAALLEKRSEIPGERVGVIFSGGNIDLERLPWLK
ncbi:pyridoxal-phosphate dependent enzyme [Opitutia bacterium ISCC 51]|nr:pyridoxal-phosphate dependent enzyme [Opitutae bacterium ISCC 51]QXD28690.1 pyridoxal-phosphate dependent enzyme [Opitutae bacterium ISCC 52]